MPLIALLLVLLFTNMWLAYRYTLLKRELVAIEEHQNRLLEENKRIIAALSILRSPQVVIPRAQQRYIFDLLDQDRIIQIEKPLLLDESTQP